MDDVSHVDARYPNNAREDLRSNTMTNTRTADEIDVLTTDGVNKAISDVCHLCYSSPLPERKSRYVGLLSIRRVLSSLCIYDGFTPPMHVQRIAHLHNS